MSFIARLADPRLRLTRADRALLALIEADPVGASLGSAVCLATRAGVHGATAGRLAKKLGFANWRALQGALRDEHIRRSSGPPVAPLGMALAALDVAAHLSLVADGTLRAGRMEPAGLQDALQTPRAPLAALDGPPSLLLRMANGMLNQIEPMVGLGSASAVEAAARRLCEARVVWVAARADVAAVGLLLKIRLGRHSLGARLLAEDEADALADASPGDVLVEVAGDAPRFRFEGLRRRAAARGLAVVLIGPPVGPDSDPPPDFHICVPAGKMGDAVLAGQLLGAGALASAVVTLRPGTPLS